MSRTCKIRLAATTSSSVARKAATSAVGRSEMKPTVSDKIARRPDASRNLAHRRIERREYLVLGEYARPRDAIEEGGLARVRIAHDRDDRIGHAGAAGAMQRPCLHHPREVFLDALDALFQHAAIEFDLGFARATEEAESRRAGAPSASTAHEAALLIGEMSSSTCSVPLGWPHVGRRSPDQPRPIENLAVPGLLQIALLNGRYGVVDNHETDVAVLHEVADLLHLARAAKSVPGRGAGKGTIALLEPPRDRWRVRGPRPLPGGR